MTLILCPGMHDPTWTTAFWQSLITQGPIALTRSPPVIFPSNRYPAYSPWHLFAFLQTVQPAPPWLFLGFSAGCVAIAGTLPLLACCQVPITAIFALDAWGVIFPTATPVHRLSHDYFTHWTSGWLGGRGESFYADPAVEHLSLWRSPQTVAGWQVSPTQPQAHYTTACQFLQQQLASYIF